MGRGIRSSLPMLVALPLVACGADDAGEPEASLREEQLAAPPAARLPVRMGPSFDHGQSIPHWPATRWGWDKGTFAWSWDGLFVVSTKVESIEDPHQSGARLSRHGLFVQVFRPTELDPMTTAGWEAAISERVELELDHFEPWGSHVAPNPYSPDPGHPCLDEGICSRDPIPHRGVAQRHGIALAPLPAADIAKLFPDVSPLQNPYPSDADGQPVADDSGEHGFSTYLFEAIQNDIATGVIGLRAGRITVSTRRLPGAPHAVPWDVHAAELVTDFEPLWFAQGDTHVTVRGIEPSVTRDGRLIVFQGNSTNDGIDHVRWTFRLDGAEVTPPATIASLHVYRDVPMVGGFRFADHYPLADKPLASATLQPLDAATEVQGAYPWISQDGDALLFASTSGYEACDPPGPTCTPHTGGGRRAKQVIVGPATSTSLGADGAKRTHFQLKVLDNPTNSRVDGTGRVVTGSVGRFDHAWDFRHRLPSPARSTLPVRPERGLLGYFSATFEGFSYAEASFRDAEDGHYLVYSGLTEAVEKTPYDGTGATGFNVVFDRAQDTSGRGNRVLLEGGAAFPLGIRETFGLPFRPDVAVGAIGQGVLCSETGSLRVPASAALKDYDRDLTVELWVRAIPGVPSWPQGGFSLAKGDAFELRIDPTGRAVATFVLEDGTSVIVGPTAAPILSEGWVHVAAVHAGSRAQAALYVDAELGASASVAPIGLAHGDSDVTFCPSVAGGSNVPMIVVDEIALSGVGRTEDELRVSALVRPSPWTSAPVPSALPNGLEAARFRAPADNPPTKDAIELGRHLFFDRRLSSDGTIACVSCHDPALGFSDGLARAVGVSGKVLPRRSPSITNLAFQDAGDRFFWDGRAASLEEQALQPFTSPDEHGLASMEEAVAIVSAEPAYGPLFAAAFGEGPSAEGMGKALASFVRSLAAGDAPFDRWLAGERGALSPSESRGMGVFLGKARCASCHHGPALGDNQFHANGFHDLDAAVADLGRFAVTSQQGSGRQAERGAFKTPSLRDLSRRGFFLHDGAASSLDPILFNYGIGGLHPANRSSEILALPVTVAELGDLRDFLDTGLRSADYPAPPDPWTKTDP